MLKTCLFLCIFSVIGSESGSVSFIKPCVWSDKKCILESSKTALPYFVKGIPELGISPVDPVYIKDINADSGDLKLNFKDLKISGMGKSVFLNIERPDADKTLILEFEFPALVTGHYIATGKIFLLDVDGDGEIEIKCDKVKVKVDGRLNIIEKDGKKYIKISGFDYSYEPVERVFFNFTKLYKGDEKKAKLLLDLINQNWKEILFGIGKPVIEEIVVQEMSKVKKFIHSIPIDELEIPQ